jgi:hypothetical protein
MPRSSATKVRRTFFHVKRLVDTAIKSSKSTHSLQNWCYIGRKLFPQIISRTVNGKTYTFSIQTVSLYEERTFTSNEFKEISLASNDLERILVQDLSLNQYFITKKGCFCSN